MADIKIKDMGEALQIDNNAEFPYTQDNGGQNTTFKAKITQIASKILEAIDFSSLNTTQKKVISAINEVNSNSEYKVGDTLSMSTVICAGIVATTKKDIRFFIPLSKPISSGVTKVNIGGRWDCRSTLGQFTSDDLSNYGTVTTTICPNGVYVRLLSTNDLNVDTNMPVSAYGSGTATLTFTTT